MVEDDEPVTLAEACRLFFGGRLTKSALRTEARKGNLEILRIANKDFVTRRAIETMKERSIRRPEKVDSADLPTPQITASEALRAMLAARKNSRK